MREQLIVADSLESYAPSDRDTVEVLLNLYNSYQTANNPIAAAFFAAQLNSYKLKYDKLKQGSGTFKLEEDALEAVIERATNRVLSELQPDAVSDPTHIDEDKTTQEYDLLQMLLDEDLKKMKVAMSAQSDKKATAQIMLRELIDESLSETNKKSISLNTLKDLSNELNANLLKLGNPDLVNIYKEILFQLRRQISELEGTYSNITKAISKLSGTATEQQEFKALSDEVTEEAG